MVILQAFSVLRKRLDYKYKNILLLKIGNATARRTGMWIDPDNQLRSF